MWLDFSIGFSCGLLLAALWLILIHRSFVIKEAKIREQHRLEFEEMLKRFSHEGMIPAGSSAAGLMNVVLLGLTRTITCLWKLYDEKDWNTREHIIELQDYARNELALLYKTLADFLASRRVIMKDYNKNQGR